MSLIEVNADFHSCRMKSEDYAAVAKSLYEEGDKEGAIEHAHWSIHWMARMIEKAAELQGLVVEAISGKELPGSRRERI